MADEFVPTRARKNRVKLKINIQGPAGSGKTKGAIAMACYIAELMALARGETAQDGKVCVIDTENESALLYADEYVFDHIPLDAPYTSERYKKAVKAAVDAKYDIVVVDSFSHWWKGDDGILSRKDKFDKAHPNSNTWANWSKFDEEITSMVEFIKHLPIHAVYAARSKQKIVLQDVGEKKNVPVKVGMEPVMRDDMDYEFDIVFAVDIRHQASCEKDRSSLFSGRLVNLLEPEVAAQIHQWATSGVETATRTISEADRLRVFGALKAHNVSPDDFRAYLITNYQVAKSEDIPASQVSAIIRWIEAAKEATPEEKIARQSIAAMNLGRAEAALLIATHNRDWEAINRTLEGMSAAQRGPAPEDESQSGEFFEENGDVQCIVIEALRKEAAGNKEFFDVKFNGKVNGKDRATCWHKSLFPALSNAKGQVVHMLIRPQKDYNAIEDVTKVGDTVYAKGKIVAPAAVSETVNQDAE